MRQAFRKFTDALSLLIDSIYLLFHSLFLNCGQLIYVTSLRIEVNCSIRPQALHRSLGLLEDGLVALSSLVLILHNVLLLKLAHALNFVKVDDEALVISMKWLDAFAAEDVQVVRAVEMLDTLWVLLAKLFRKTLLILIFEVKAGAGKDWILFHDFVQDVDVEGESLGALQLLDQLATDGASDTVFVVKLLNAVRAQSMAAVDQYAGDALTDIVLESTELTNVETTRLVVKVHEIS